MSYHKIGVFGATGLLGQEVTRALVEEGFNVVPFSRQNTIVAGVRTQALGSLVGFDAIVSTVGHTGMKEQIPLIKQAKLDGVKRFVPSEFGVDHRIVKADFFKPKMDVLQAAKEADFPDGWTAIASGFLDLVIPQFIKVDPDTATITVRGSGKKEFPFSVRHDLGRILAHTFKHPAGFKDTWLTVANGWFSLDQIAQVIGEKSGHDFQIQHLELDEKVPVLRVLEQGGLDIFDRKGQTLDLPVQMTDIKELMQWPSS